MKILVGSLTYPLVNGVTTSINISLDGFIKAGHEVMVVGPKYSIGVSRPEHHVLPSSVPARLLLQVFNKKERMFGLGAGSQLRTLIDHFQPDAYWLHTVTWGQNAFETAMYHSDAAKVLTFHTLVEQYGQIYGGALGASILRRRSRLVANHMDAVITPSQVIAKKLIEYGVHRPIYVIPTGISLPGTLFTRQELIERFHLPKNSKILIYVGRVSAEKNIHTLLRLTQQLQKMGQFSLLLVGPGDIVATEEEADRLGIGRQVFCTGPLPKEDAQRCYGGADAFVFASQTETQGLVIGEAMLANIPVVALDSPIRPEVYPETVASVVTNEAEFARAVIDILDDRPARLKQTKAAKQFVEKNFSIEGMIAKQLAVFTKVTTGRQANYTSNASRPNSAIRSR